jgi:ribosomal RNA-processing protein 9
VGQIAAPGFVNSLQLLSIPKGALDEATWASEANSTDGRSATALLIAGMGKEPRLGRWMNLKGEGVTNSTLVVALYSRRRA